MSPRRGYSVREVGKLVGLPDARIRDFARACGLGTRTGPGRAWRFGFQDLVLMRAAKGLATAAVPHRRILRVLGRLRMQVPEGKPLSTVHIGVVGSQIVARSAGSVWSPDSGQARFDFGPAAGRERPRLRESTAFLGVPSDTPQMGAADWFEIGEELFSLAPEEAREAFRRTLELSPLHALAHARLARLLRDVGELHAAEQHCRVAVEEDPKGWQAFLELGLTLDACGRAAEAGDALRRAIRLGCHDHAAYDALIRISEEAGDGPELARWGAAKRRLPQPAPTDGDTA